MLVGVRSGSVVDAEPVSETGGSYIGVVVAGADGEVDVVTVA